MPIKNIDAVDILAARKDGKGLSTQDIAPRGLMGPITEKPTENNMKLIGIDFYHRYKEDIKSNGKSLV